jgi:hypothetical protein
MGGSGSGCKGKGRGNFTATSFFLNALELLRTKIIVSMNGIPVSDISCWLDFQGAAGQFLQPVLQCMPIDIIEQLKSYRTLNENVFRARECHVSHTCAKRPMGFD